MSEGLRSVIPALPTKSRQSTSGLLRDANRDFEKTIENFS